MLVASDTSFRRKSGGMARRGVDTLSCLPEEKRRLPPISSNAGTAVGTGMGDVCGDMDDDDLTKTERGKRGLEHLRALLREIAVVGMPESHVGIKIDVARALEGLDRAEEAIEQFERGGWTAEEVLGEETREAIISMAGESAKGDCESERGTEDALADLRAAASDELREASLDRVLSAAERGMRWPTSLARRDVVDIEGEEWEIRAALGALRDKELDVEDVLEAITGDGGEGGSFASAVGVVALGEESLPEAAERRGVDAAAVADALARYKLPGVWESERWGDEESRGYRTEGWEMDDEG